MSNGHDDLVIRIVVVVTLGIVLVAAIVGLTVTAVATDRDLFRPELYTFGGVCLLAGLGGVSWWSLQRRRAWRFNIERNGTPGSDPRTGVPSDPRTEGGSSGHPGGD